MNLYKFVDVTGGVGKLFPGLLWLFIIFHLNKRYSFLDGVTLEVISDNEILFLTAVSFLSYIIGSFMLPFGFFIADLVSDIIDWSLGKIKFKRLFQYMDMRLGILCPESRNELIQNFAGVLREYAPNLYGESFVRHGGASRVTLAQCKDYLLEHSDYYGRDLRNIGAQMNFYAALWLPIAFLGYFVFTDILLLLLFVSLFFCLKYQSIRVLEVKKAFYNFVTVMEDRNKHGVK